MLYIDFVRAVYDAKGHTQWRYSIEPHWSQPTFEHIGSRMHCRREEISTWLTTCKYVPGRYIDIFLYPLCELSILCHVWKVSLHRVYTVCCLSMLFVSADIPERGVVFEKPFSYIIFPIEKFVMKIKCREISIFQTMGSRKIL